MTRKEILEWGHEMADKIFHKKKDEKEVTINGWISRDQDGKLLLGTKKPIKGREQWSFNIPCWFVGLPYFVFKNHFDNVQWSDPEATPCEITIKLK